MMPIEIDVLGERLDPLIVTSFIGDGTMDEAISVGYKKYLDKARQFEYNWLIEEMQREEVLELVNALMFVLDHQLPCPGCEEMKEEL